MGKGSFQVKAELRQIVNCEQLNFSHHATIKKACGQAIECINEKDAEIRALKARIKASDDAQLAMSGQHG